MSRLSVVIPTYNRKTTLKKALQAYRRQSTPQEIVEILVIDDDSTDGTEAIVAECGQASAIPIRYFRQQHKGPAAARNIGIQESRGELILFTDDDIIPGPSLVAEHVEWHRQHPEPFVAVLGYVTWSPELRPTPFMEWYGLSGALFAYGSFKRGAELDCRFFYTCNLSLKTGFLRKNGLFDEDFKSAAWEDIELGCRLQRLGLRLLYNSDAIAYHHQHFSFADACLRARRCAMAHRVFEKKEVARYLSELGARRDSSLRSRIAESLARWMVRSFPPLKVLVDSRIPLPWTLYGALFSHYTESGGKAIREDGEQVSS